MRVVSEELDAEVGGTSSGDRIEASVFRGFGVAIGPLNLAEFSLGWDTDRQVQGQSTVTLADPDGELAPWGMGDALAPGGSRMDLTWVSGLSGTRVPLGTWRIRQALPSESWLVYGTSGGPRMVHGGGKVTLAIDEDVTATAIKERIDGTAPTPGGSVLAEIALLVRDFGAIDASEAPADANIPTSYSAFPESRMDAIDDLLDMIQAVARVGADGSLQIVPRAGIGPVWTVAGGDDGALVSISRAMSDDGVYNGATSHSTTDDGSPLVGRAFLDGGPLAWGGPFGRVPIFHQAIARTLAGVVTDAQTTLTNRNASGTVDLAITCLAHAGIQGHDLVTVVAPTTAGESALVGRVVGMRWSSVQSESGSTPAKSMELTVRVPTEALEAVAQRVRRG